MRTARPSTTRTEMPQPLPHWPQMVATCDSFPSCRSGAPGTGGLCTGIANGSSCGRATQAAAAATGVAISSLRRDSPLFVTRDAVIARSFLRVAAHALAHGNFGRAGFSERVLGALHVL